MSSKTTKYIKLLADYEKHCQRIAKATTIDINEPEDIKRARIKRLEQDYVLWFEYYFPNFAKKRCAWFHRELARLIISNRRIRLLAEMFRSAGKSVHICMGIPLFLYLAKGDLKFMLLIGKTEKKAQQLLSGIQSQLQYNNRLKNDYGDKYQQGNWAEGDFTTTDGIKFMSLGFAQDCRGVREQGERPDYIACDDVDGKKHLNNDRIMVEFLDYLTEDVWGCFDADDDSTERFVYANNNFHKYCLTNRLKGYFNIILKKKANDRLDKTRTQPRHAASKNPTLFKVLEVNAVKDTVNFEPAWPEKTSAAYWREKYESMPHRSFMREYMNTHISEGRIFKHEHIQYKKILPLNEYDALCFYGDLSYKDQGDYKSLVLVGQKGKEYHLILCYLRQKSRANCAKWLYDMYEQHHLQKYNIRYMIEGLFAQDEFVTDFDNEGEKRGYYIPVRADKRPKEGKFDRVESLSGNFERLWVFFNELLKDDEDTQRLIEQFLAFEKGSLSNDDGPDSFHGATSHLNKRTHKSKSTYAFGARINNHF